MMQVEMLKKADCTPFGKDFLELGTGWQPVIPLLFYLAGCRTITLVDSQRLLDKNTLFETSTNLIKYRNKISEKLEITANKIQKELSRSKFLSMNSLIKSFNFKYLAPFDILSNDLSDSSFDIITSRAVLEHIPPNIIQKMFHKFIKILKPNGKMCHIIDNSDHWEHHDKRITRLNFLKYGDKPFKLLSSMNPLDYQNRLRHYQYKEMIEKAGFKVIIDQSHPDKKAFEELRTLKLHNSFKHIPPEELAILTSYIVASK